MSGVNLALGHTADDLLDEKGRLPPSIKMNDAKNEAFLKQIGVSGLDIELMDICNEEDMQQLKKGFRLRFPVFMANILKILLYRGEEKLACLLTAYYEISLDEEMIFTAVENKQYAWLNFVWAFGKNYLNSRRMPNAKQVHFLQLFECIKKYYQRADLYRRDMRTVCKWMFPGNDDILHALLHHREDSLCLEFMGYYSRFLEGGELFLFALEHGNSNFMQKALLESAFDKSIFKD